jgi:hypothetical protein
MKSQAPSLLLPAWRSLPGPDRRLKCDQTLGWGWSPRLTRLILSSAPEFTCTKLAKSGSGKLIGMAPVVSRATRTIVGGAWDSDLDRCCRRYGRRPTDPHPRIGRYSSMWRKGRCVNGPCATNRQSPLGALPTVFTSKWTILPTHCQPVAVGIAWKCAAVLGGKAADAQLITRLLHLHDTSNRCICLK